MSARNFGDSRLDVSYGSCGVVFVERKDKNVRGRWVQPGGTPEVVAIPPEAVAWLIAELQITNARQE